LGKCELINNYPAHYDGSSEGTHRLIGERAAEIVTSVGDAVELITSLEQLV
jgi:hypothetical protein